MPKTESDVREELYGGAHAAKAEPELDAPFVKHDEKKPRYSLLPVGALATVVAVMEHGAAKYGADNWRNCEDPTRYWDAAQRHLWASSQLNFRDPETNLPAIAHAIASLLILLELTFPEDAR